MNLFFNIYLVTEFNEHDDEPHSSGIMNIHSQSEYNNQSSPQPVKMQINPQPTINNIHSITLSQSTSIVINSNDGTPIYKLVLSPIENDKTVSANILASEISPIGHYQYLICQIRQVETHIQE